MSARPRRTARDWVVDFTCFLLAVVIGVLGADALETSRTSPAPGRASSA